MNISDLRIGSTFELEEKIYIIVDYQHSKRSRGAAIVRTKIKNLETGQVLERTFSPSDVVGEAFIDKNEMQYIYNNEDLYYFMDNETFEQVPINKDDIGDNLKFIKEGMNLTIQKCKGKIISVTPPIFVELQVTDCDPAVVGDTAKSAHKTAVLENGFTIKVPMFIATGDVLKIDTRNGEYVERISKS